MKPRLAPKRMARGMASGNGMPSDCASQPKTMAAHTPMAPTERSSPPVTITAIMARPIMVSMPIWRPMVNRLKGEVKPSSDSAKAVKAMAMRTARPNSLLSSSRSAPEPCRRAGMSSSVEVVSVMCQSSPSPPKGERAGVRGCHRESRHQQGVSRNIAETSCGLPVEPPPHPALSPCGGEGEERAATERASCRHGLR